MQRRTFLGTTLAVTTASPLFASLLKQRRGDVADVLERATARCSVRTPVGRLSLRRALVGPFLKEFVKRKRFSSG